MPTQAKEPVVEVIGAGSMGCAIAALFVDAGISIQLKNREGQVEKVIEVSSSHFQHGTISLDPSKYAHHQNNKPKVILQVYAVKSYDIKKQNS